MGINEECSLLKVDDSHFRIIISTESDPYLSETKMKSLIKIISHLNSNNNIKVVEIVGSDKYFAAGGKIEFLTNIDSNSLPEMFAKIPEIILSIKAITVANMKGHAMGGGLAIGLWSDLPCLCESSLYGANFMSLGFTPGMGSSIILENYFGKPFASEMLLTGQLYKGKYIKNSIIPPISYRIYSSSEYDSKVESLISNIKNIEYLPLILLKETLVKQRHRDLALVAKDEIAMHKICFSDSETANIIANNYLGSIDKPEL